MKNRLHFQRRYLSIPYLVFNIAFVVLPLLLIVYYAFTDSQGAFSLANLSDFFSSSGNIWVLVVSILIGLGNTAICLLIGYPIAMLLANKKYNKSYILVLLFIMPMWINFVLRTGATRDLLGWLGIDGGHYPYVTTMIGMVYNYLPFVILPLYSTMLKLDKSQIEASYDLGANKLQTFYKTIIPMSMPGISSAVTMVLMPTMSSYVISDIMSERKITLIGNYINDAFGQSLWNAGSLYALIMLILVFITMKIFKNQDEDARGGLW